MKTLRGNLKGKSLRIGIIASRFNEEITKRLVEGALSALSENGVSKRAITLVSVPGAFEIPGTALRMALKSKFDAIVCLGAVIRGETDHSHFVAAAAQEGILRAGMDTGVPITFGVLTTNSIDEAIERSGGDWGNKGYEAAEDAIEMANLYHELG